MKKTTAVLATTALVGISTLLMATPASAATTCAFSATLISSNVCELTLTGGVTSLTPTKQMTQLEALLVGGGGSGGDGTFTYGAGGGGQVTLVGFDPTLPLTISVGEADEATSVVQDSVTHSAAGGGGPGTVSAPATGGASGSGMAGFSDASALLSGGGGAGAAATIPGLGGDGVVVANIAGVGSLFAGDSTGYGGGGGDTANATDYGGGHSGAASRANSGGGGTHGQPGAAGVVVLRWVALPDVTATFVTGGRGGAVASQTVPAGSVASSPGVLSETGYTFNGWFTDAALTAPANFSTPLTSATSFYASWTAESSPSTPPAATVPTKVLPPTGGGPDFAAASAGLAALVAGLGLLTLRAKRTRKSN